MILMVRGGGVQNLGNPDYVILERSFINVSFVGIWSFTVLDLRQGIAKLISVHVLDINIVLNPTIGD